MDNPGIIWTLVLGALGGFAGGWFQSYLRRDEERLKLHREKLETLYSMVNEWNEAALSILVRGIKDSPSNEDWYEIEKVTDKIRIKTKRITPLIRFYANSLFAKILECRKCWLEFTTAINSSERDGEEINKHYDALKHKLSEFDKAIINETEKYIPQSFTYVCISRLLKKWKPKAL